MKQIAEIVNKQLTSDKKLTNNLEKETNSWQKVNKQLKM